MLRMRSRTEIPQGGWKWFDPKTQWKPDFGLRDFYACRDEIVAHNAANPRHGLSTNLDEVADALDFFNAAIRKGDPRWCVSDALGKSQPPSAAGASSGGLKSAAAAVVEKAKKYVAGVGVLIHWLGSGSKTVPQELAEKRAEICSGCPKNTPGDWESHFTGEAAEIIRQELSIHKDMALATRFDKQLGTCDVCLCRMVLKIWVPLDHVRRKLKPEQEAELWENCWIRSENKA